MNTIQDIKDAVNAGKVVNWCHAGYTVVCDKYGQWFIKHAHGCIGLHSKDNVLNGNIDDFYVEYTLYCNTSL